MIVTIITDKEPYIFEHVSYISVEHEFNDSITQYGNGNGFVIEERAEDGTEK